MLSDGPWSLVESFPRRQGPSVPSRHETQPTRWQGPTETGSIGTNSPGPHDPSAPCPVGTEGPMTLGTMSPRGYRRLDTMVPRLLGTLPHRTGMSLAPLLPRRMGHQVPWLMSRLGTMVPRRPKSHDARRPGSLGTSTTELFQECWGQDLTGPLVPSLCWQHGFKAPHGTWDPSDRSGHGRRRLAGTLVPRCLGIQRSISRR
jgi:hypothetical protein